MKSMKILSFIVLAVFVLLSTQLKAVTLEDLKEYEIGQSDKCLIDILMDYGDSMEFPILIRAMAKKDYPAVIKLIQYGVDINARAYKAPYHCYPNNIQDFYRTVLEMAIAEGKVSLVEYLLVNKADPTNNLRMYNEYYHTVQHKKYRTDWVTTAVYDAIMLDRLDILILFTQFGVDLNKACYEKSELNGSCERKTPLQVAIEHKKKEIVAFLLSIGIDL